MSIVPILPVIWLAAILAALFMEVLTEKLITVWCAPAAAVAFLCGLFGMRVHGQLTIFVVLSLAMITASQVVCAVLRRSEKHKNSGGDIQ